MIACFSVLSLNRKNAMKKLPDLNQITPAALLNMPTATQLQLLDELEYRAYLVRTLAGIHHEHGGHFMRRCVDTLRLLRDAGAGDAQALQAVLQDGEALRSEERRVGKECSVRGAA